jgi:hypothetical protein
VAILRGVEPVDRWKPQPAPPAGDSLGDHSDQLPEELNAAGYVGPYLFPDNSRRRIAGAFYLVAGVLLLALWAWHHHNGVLVDRGFLVAGLVAIAFGAYHQVAGYSLRVQDLDALTHAGSAVGFPVGHASAQLGWRGLRSRPTWRILLYSADEPPSRRGFVLIDGVDGKVIDMIMEDNPEDWSSFDT